MTTVTDPVRHVIRLTNAVVASRALHLVAEVGVADVIDPTRKPPSR